MSAMLSPGMSLDPTTDLAISKAKRRLMPLILLFYLIALVRFGARRWIARIMFTWGAFAMLMAFTRGPVSFLILRFLLGSAEAGFAPGIVYYMMVWFPAKERANVVSI